MTQLNKYPGCAIEWDGDGFDLCKTGTLTLPTGETRKVEQVRAASQYQLHGGALGLGTEKYLLHGDLGTTEFSSFETMLKSLGVEKTD